MYRNAVVNVFSGLAHDELCVSVEEVWQKAAPLTNSFAVFEALCVTIVHPNAQFLLLVKMLYQPYYVVQETHAALCVPQVAVLSTVKCFAAVYVASVDVHIVGNSAAKSVYDGYSFLPCCC